MNRAVCHVLDGLMKGEINSHHDIKDETVCLYFYDSLSELDGEIWSDEDNFDFLFEFSKNSVGITCGSYPSTDVMSFHIEGKRMSIELLGERMFQSTLKFYDRKGNETGWISMEDVPSDVGMDIIRYAMNWDNTKKDLYRRAKEVFDDSE